MDFGKKVAANVAISLEYLISVVKMSNIVINLGMGTENAEYKITHISWLK